MSEQPDATATAPPPEPAGELKTGPTYTRVDALNACVRPTSGLLAAGFLLVMPVGVLVAVGVWPDSGVVEAFKMVWAAASPIAGAVLMYFFKSREIGKAAGNGGAS